MDYRRETKQIKTKNKYQINLITYSKINGSEHENRKEIRIFYFVELYMIYIYKA